jgi:hypothetical protein
MNNSNGALTIGLIIFLIFIAGCTSTAQNPSSDSNSKVKSFSDIDNSFSAQLTNITVKTRGQDIYDITVFIKVQNTGNKALSLVAYDGITDWAGVGYTFGSTSFGTLYPGESTISHDGVTITSKKSYMELVKGATFTSHFLDDKRNTHDASWVVNLGEIPIMETTQVENTLASNLVNPSCSGWSCT